MIKELDIVALTHDIEEHGLLKGSHGTVVHCYKNGQGFEVEFVDATSVLTLGKSDIKLDRTVIQTQVVEILDHLPEEILVEVRDFAEFLKQKHLGKAS